MNWESLTRALRHGLLAGHDAAPLPAGIEPAPHAATGEIEVLGEALREEVRRMFGGSLKLRHLDAGSCNGCETELQALLGGLHQLRMMRS